MSMRSSTQRTISEISVTIDDPDDTNTFPPFFSLHRNVNAMEVPKSHFAPRRGELVRDPNDNKMRKMRESICNCRDEGVVTEGNLDTEQWDSFLAKLEDSADTDHTTAYGSFKRNTLMIACMLDPPLKVIKHLVKFGGKEAILGQCSCGFTALHYACQTNASQEVIQYLVEVGGEEALMKRCKIRGSTPLHTACMKYKSDSLPNVIQHMIKTGKHAILTTIDDNSEIPLHCMLLRHGGLPVEAIIAYFDSWYELEKTAPTILSFSKDSWKLYQENCNEICLAFNKTIRQIEKISEEDKGQILKTPFMKMFLTRRFIHRAPLAIIMTDLYVQILIVYILSFCTSNDVSYPHCSTNTGYLLKFCACWRLFREVIQVMTTSLGDYVREVSNWIDWFQIMLIISTINITLENHVMEDDHLMASEDRIALALATFISWFELLYELHNFIYDLAIFVVATMKVLKHLVPFVFTTIIFVLAFAHTYLIAGPHDEHLCSNRRNNITNARFMEEGGWACTRMDSVEFASNIFFNFEIPSGVPLGITYAFACVMSIFLLNVLVAVISTAFDDVQSESETVFWADRLRIVDEVQAITSFIQSVCTRKKHSNIQKKSNTTNININHPLAHTSKKQNLSTSTKKKKRKKKKKKKNMLISNDKENNERFDFNSFLEQSVWSQLSSNDDRDSEYILWWYGKSEKRPPTIERLSFFFRRSDWNDILCPGAVFENILLGRDRSSDDKGLLKIFTFFCSVILMVVINAFTAIIFISGLVSFGLLWPLVMKEFLFTVYDVNNEAVDESGKLRNENIDLLKEIKEMRDAHSKDISEMREEQNDLKSDIMEILSQNFALKNEID